MPLVEKILLVALLGIVASLVLLALTLFFWLQAATFFINYLGANESDSDFWTTGNFWAWALTILIFLLSIALIKGISTVVNFLAVVLISRAGESEGPYPEVSTLYVGIALIAVWFALGIWIASELFAFLASYPDFSDFFTEGNWFAWLCTYIAVVTITAPLESLSFRD